MNNIEIDISAFSKLSAEALETKKDQVGFYKKDGHTFVLTTRSGTSRSDFVSKIDQLAKLLENADFSTEQRSQLSTDHTIKMVQYFDCVYRIIDRHNAKVETAINNSWISFLAKIPVISWLVRWIFNSLNTPERFLNRFFILEAQSIRDYLAPSPDIDAAVKRKDALMKLTSELEDSNRLLRGTGHTAWNKTKEIIQNAFEEQLIKIIPELILAHKMLSATPNDPGAAYRQILNLTADDDVVKAYEQCTQLQKDLQWDGSIEEVITNPLRALSDKAKHLALDAYRHLILDGQAVRSYFAAAVDFDELKKRQKALSDMTDELRIAQNRLGSTETIVWGKTREIIQNAFEEQINDKVPAVKLAHKLLKTTYQDPDRIYREILGLADETEAAKAPDICNAILRDLKWDSLLKDQITDEQKKLCDEAKALAVKAYAQWQVQRLCRLGQQAQKAGHPPAMAELFGTPDSTQFAKKYKSLVERLKSLDMPAAHEALKMLQTCYFEYLNQHYTALEKELNNDSLILKQSNLKELLQAYNERMQVLQDRLQFGATAFSTICLDHTINALKEKLVNAYYRRLKCSVTIFGEATSILNIHTEQIAQSSEVPQLTHETGAASALLSEKWYKHKITFFKFELAQLDEKDFSPEAWHMIQTANQKLLADLSRLKEKQMVESLKVEKKPQSPFEAGIHLIAKFFIGEDKGKDQPLKLYREDLMKILDMKELRNPAEIERKYKAKLAEITTLPNSEGMKTLLNNAYDNYQRALCIQPLLTKVASTWFSENLTLEDLFKEKKLSTNLLDVEKTVNTFLNQLNDEIGIQNTKPNNPLVDTLEKAKTNVLECWEDLLMKHYPQFKVITTIQQSITEDDPEYLYQSILECTSLNVPYADVCEKHEQLLESIKIIGENQPVHLQAAYMEAANWVILAYKEWEADRILALPTDSSIERIYGVAPSLTPKEMKIRWRKLKLLLHTDKNVEIPPKLADKITEGGKLVPDYSENNL